MKFKVGDKVIITAGKDKGKKGKIKKVLPDKDSVIVEGVNTYVKHMKPYAGRDGQRIVRERPINVAKIAILNEKGEPDRIGYKILKSKKIRIFKKTDSEITYKSESSK